MHCQSRDEYGNRWLNVAISWAPDADDNALQTHLQLTRFFEKHARGFEKNIK
jgi:hypothetical protein